MGVTGVTPSRRHAQRPRPSRAPGVTPTGVARGVTSLLSAAPGVRLIPAVSSADALLSRAEGEPRAFSRARSASGCPTPARCPTPSPETGSPCAETPGPLQT
jgi:hypothetical protein